MTVGCTHVLWVCLFFNCSTVVPESEKSCSIELAGIASFNLCTILFIFFLLQFSKNFMGYYWVTKMGADFASLCQKMFITLIIHGKIMFQQVKTVRKTWHMCELAISHCSYNIVINNKTKGETMGRGISHILIWSWSFDMWSSLDPDMQSAACVVSFSQRRPKAVALFYRFPLLR